MDTTSKFKQSLTVAASVAAFVSLMMAARLVGWGIGTLIGKGIMALFPAKAES